LAKVREAVQRVSEVTGTDTAGPPDNGEVTLSVYAQGDVDLRSELAKAVVESGASLLGLGRSKMSLEDVFRGLTLESKTSASSRGASKRDEEEQPEEEQPEEEEDAEETDDSADSDDENEKEEE
jgi:hypothetical protein